MIKVLIVGLGSIGQRHANALHEIGVTEIAALRTNKGQKPIDLSFDVIEFYSEEEAFLWNPTHMVISNPTSLHVPYVELAIRKDIPFFVEKPISDDMDDIHPQLRSELCQGVVGYNLRFHGLFNFIKRAVESKTYGEVVTAKLHVGQYLPNWHPYEDYRNAYYAKKELGGGGLRTLSHEIDLIQYFFGKVNTVFAKVEKNSNLEIDVDDVTNIIANADLCSQINLHINLLDPRIKRKGNIYFTKGVLEYDFIKSKVIFVANNGDEDLVYSTVEDINIQYQNQMKEFVGMSGSSFACSFEEGLQVKQIIEMCEQSNDQKKEICLV